MLTIPNPASEAALPPLPSEQLMIDQLPLLGGSRALVVSPGRAQLADHLSGNHGMQYVGAWYMDMHAASAANLVCADAVDIQCGSDLPEVPLDLVAIPVLIRSEAELTRELLQQAHIRLAEGGHLATSVDNPRDHWLHEQMQELFDKVSCVRNRSGCVYWARKESPLKKVRDFSCQFQFRDEDQRTLQVVTRPGVFSHRRLDPGARQLMLAAEIGAADNVLEIGCGAGPVTFAAAVQTTGKVFAVDSSARAIECVQRGAALNGIHNVHCLLNADGGLELSEPIDIALANPPYFGNDRISQHFVDTAAIALRSGGALLVVTKQPGWYEAYFETIFEDIAVFESGRYFIACGRKP